MINANLTIPMDCVLHALLDMILLMELVSLELSTLPSLPTQDVANGTGTTRCALSALLNGLSMLIKFASPSLIFVLLTMPMELASHASRDMTSSMEFASSLPSTMLNPQTQDVPNGIGTTKSASNAQRTGPSTLMELVCQFLIFVPPMMPQVLASHASKVTISSMESVNSPHSITLSLQTKDAVNGTGITKSASSAQLNGPSMLIKFAFQ